MRAARISLAAVHRGSILHGDIRRDNFMVVDAPEGSENAAPVVLVQNFGAMTFTRDVRRFKEESSKLASLLNSMVMDYYEEKYRKELGDDSI